MVYFPHLFLLILKHGFIGTEFLVTYEYAKNNLVTYNDKGEEAIAYAALGAVFGAGLGCYAVDQANKYWQSQGENGMISVSRTDIVAQFFEFVERTFTVKKYWDGYVSNYYDKPPFFLDYVFYCNDGAQDFYYLSVGSLVRFGYEAGFKVRSTISESAMIGAITAKFRMMNKIVSKNRIWHNVAVIEGEKFNELSEEMQVFLTSVKNYTNVWARETNQSVVQLFGNIAPNSTEIKPVIQLEARDIFEQLQLKPIDNGD
jgi:hypothetical protein